MRASRLSRLSGGVLAVCLGLSLQACVPQPLKDAAIWREPVRWILVERRYGDVESAGAVSDGRVNPDAMILAFQPLYPEDLTWEVMISPEDHFVELVDYSPSGPVAPGEVVSATVRVGKAKMGQRYRLVARASRADVSLLGASDVVVVGTSTAVFRFTSATSGRAGIEVGVERIDSCNQQVP